MINSRCDTIGFPYANAETSKSLERLECTKSNGSCPSYKLAGQTIHFAAFFSQIRHTYPLRCGEAPWEALLKMMVVQAPFLGHAHEKLLCCNVFFIITTNYPHLQLETLTQSNVESINNFFMISVYLHVTCIIYQHRGIHKSRKKGYGQEQNQIAVYYNMVGWYRNPWTLFFVFIVGTMLLLSLPILFVLISTIRVQVNELSV